MNKNRYIFLAAVIIIPVMTGCGDTKTPTTSLHTEEESASLDPLLFSDATDTEFSFDAPYGEVELCDYKNLTAEKKSYEITDADIQEQIEFMLYDYVDYQDADRPSKTGDYVSVTMIGSDGDNVIFEYKDETFDVNLGSEEFGPEFDKHLTGVSIGDSLQFSITYDDDYEDAELAGLSIDYDITVQNIYEEILPELTDEFITDTLDYASRDDMVAQITQQIREADEEESEFELRENLIQQVIDNSTLVSCSESLYDYCLDSIDASYFSYAEMFGCETVQEVYTLFGMTDSDVKDEAENLAFRMISIQAISEAENISLSEEDISNGMEQYAEEMEYDSVESMLEEYDEDAVRSWILEDKVLDFLVDNAAIQTVTAVRDDDTAE